MQDNDTAPHSLTAVLTHPLCVEILHVQIGSTVGVRAHQHTTLGHVQRKQFYTLTQCASFPTTKRSQHQRRDLQDDYVTHHIACTDRERHTFKQLESKMLVMAWSWNWFNSESLSRSKHSCTSEEVGIGVLGVVCTTGNMASRSSWSTA